MENLKPFLIHLLKEKSKKVLNYFKEYLLWNIFFAFWLLLIITITTFTVGFLFWDFSIVETVFTHPIPIRIFIVTVLAVSLSFTIEKPEYYTNRFKQFKRKVEQYEK